MRQSERNKRNHIIVGLCAILVIMSVGFAAFSTSLNINSSAGITGTWCVGFDSSEGSVTPTKGPKTATSPTGSISYTGSTCLSSYRGGASLSASLYQPGDSVTYTLTIKNASSLAAAINSVNVGGSNVNKNTTITKGNIIFTVNMPLDTSLSASESTTMSITATFQNKTNITGPYNGESQSLNVSVNTSQDTGSGGMVVENDTYVYRWSTTEWAANQNISGMTEGTDYVTSASAVTNMHPEGANYYLKYKIENNIVTESYVCFKTDTEHCLRGGKQASESPSAFYADNVDVLSSQQTWFTSSPQNGSCSLNPSGSDSYCYGGLFNNVYAHSSGYVFVNDTAYSACNVDSVGASYCSVYSGGGSG